MIRVMGIEVPHKLSIVLILAVGLSLAAAFGYIFQRLRLSPIIGFLFAGYLIGPFSPGFVVDTESAEQLAEIGVILMMFGVGMHFKWQDLAGVKGIAIPGAILQTLVAAAAATALMVSLGWTLQASVIMGFSIGVASTVVLVRVLADNQLLHTTQGHIAVGWLIVEDFLTVVVLILLPTFASLDATKEVPWQHIFTSFGMVLVNFVIMTGLMLTAGRWVITQVLFYIARTRSEELFTLAVLGLTFIVALGSSLAFGTSIALGAFIAGMVIGQTEVRHHALANALPLKDLFGAIFFLAVGMLFDPVVLSTHLYALLGVLTIILIVKPLTAFAFTRLLGYSFGTAFTVALALGQIGEFSFILAEQGMKLGIFPDSGFDMIVACAIASIVLNPILFRVFTSLSKGSAAKRTTVDDRVTAGKEQKASKVLIVGFGPIGQQVHKTLIELDYSPIVIDRNIDTIAPQQGEMPNAVFGDAAAPHILEIAGVEEASLVVITIPDCAVATAVASNARRMNPKVQILARVQFIADRQALAEFCDSVVCCEELCLEAFDADLRSRYALLRSEFP